MKMRTNNNALSLSTQGNILFHGIMRISACRQSRFFMERSTRQRAAIRAVIDAAGRPLTPQEILDGAREHVAEIGIATVYRNLKLLLDEGSIQAVSLPGENARYESMHPPEDHHHHFHCRTCDRVFDIHGCPGPMEKLAPKGFVVDRHDLTLYGTCADCAGTRTTRSRSSQVTSKGTSRSSRRQ